MPWTMGILLFTMSVIMLSSSLRAGPESFFESGTPYGAVSENTIRLGKLLIGDRSAEEADEYRSNEEERFRLAKAKLLRLGPSVYCGNDSMTLRIPGSRTPHFLIDRGIESPVSLSEMPASCGFSLKRARRDVSLGAPYQGCHVREQGGRYILPLLIMGAPVQMSCPVTQPTLAPTTVAPVQDPVDGQQMFYPSPFGKPMWYPPYSHGHPGVRPIAPTVPPTTTTPLQDPQQMFPLQDPRQQMFYPSPFGKPMWYPPYSHGHPGVRPIAPTVPPTTTTPLQDPRQQMFPLQDPQQQMFPLQDPQQQMFYPSPFGKPMWYPPYSHGRPGVLPIAPTVPPTTTTLQDPQQRMFPLQDPRQMFYPSPFGKSMSYPPCSHGHGERPIDPIVPPTTTPLQDPQQQFPFQDPRQMFYPSPFGKPMSYPPCSHGRPGELPIAPTVPPTTTTPLQDPQQQMYPMSMFDPDHFNSRGFPAPWHYQSRYPKFPSDMYRFETPATTTPSTTAAQFNQFAGYPPLYPKFYGPPPFVRPRVPVPFMPRDH